ncbi:MAG TPA: sigma-54 dependent transcriptional regulator [Methylomirabilota bacterium]|nr:sigma-54 dependent transcriptional regulator [Methylomirabilota bacterium]
MNLNVAVIMPPGPERDSLAEHLAGRECSVRVADTVAQHLARSGNESCEIALLDFGPGAPGLPSAIAQVLEQKRRAVRSLKENWPKLQLVVFADRDSQQATETLELGVRNIFLKPVNYTQLDGLLSAAGRSVAQQARQQHEHARIEQEFRFERIVGGSPAIHESLDLARRVAQSSATSVLILGESGVGKELFARAIHGESPRKQGPFMEVNCAAIPRELLESELFGHEKGAFTDATQTRIGLFEAAEGGSVFLDEVGELPLTLQAKLLKFLDSKIVRRVGGSRDIPVDVRILAATNRELISEVKQGRFREDLYYRLNVVPIEIPPLRAREGDPVLLARLFVERVARKLARTVHLSSDGEREIARYHWPGNVRELSNVIERAVLLARSEEIGPAELAVPSAMSASSDDLSGFSVTIPPQGISLPSVERAVIQAALDRASGNVVEAARLLKIGRGSLRSKMRRHGVDRPRERRAGVLTEVDRLSVI